MFEIDKRLMGRALTGVAAALIAGLLPVAATAQETRAEEIAKKQDEKAATAAPYKPTAYERIMTRLEQNYVSPPSGFYPLFGSIYPGGGFTLGVGYQRFYARDSVWDIKGLYSVKNYKQIEVGVRTPWHHTGKWSVGMRGGWRDAPQVTFYGIGPDSSKANRANFALEQVYGAGNVTVRPTWWTRLHGEVAYEDFKNEEGTGRFPSVETLYNSFTAPGLFEDLKYIHSEAGAAIDWRTSADYSRKGGLYSIKLNDYNDRDKTFSFRRMDGEIVQHLPILRENWVISVRGRVQSIVDDDDQVPYYMLPYLGSGSTLRGYPTARFQDRHALLTSAEFRWIPNRYGLDMAFFYDAGKVASRRSDLDFNDLKTNWGVGARFHGPSVTALRLEAARGSEGWRFIFSSGAAF